jgi:SAM-dependent methyltransferase
VNWSEDEKIIDEMNKASSGELWGHKLQGSSHFPVLKALLDHVGHHGLLLDVGCGAGDVSNVWGGQYIGADLDWVIENVSKKQNSNASFLKIDIQNDDLSQIPSCRVVFANALLDVVHNPAEILKKLCNIRTEYVIIHRQRLRESKPPEMELRKSYGGSMVPSSVITFSELGEISKQFAIDNTVIIVPWESDSFSFIMRIK